MSRLLRTRLGHVVLACLAPIPSVMASVVLNEVAADNRSAVRNGADYPDYVEILNTGPNPAGLGGWSLTDDAAVPRKFVLPAGTTLPAGGRLLIWCDGNTASPGLHSGFGLGAAGDVVRLYRPDGTTVADEVVFGLQAEDLSLGRVPDGTGAWVLTAPTPLEANAALPLAPAAALRINEWMARPAVGEDWLELYNPEPQPVALGGLVLTDRASGTPNNRAIPALSFIAARGHRQFFASDLQQPGADHLDFRLGASGETLTLYAADRAAVLDRVVFGPQPDNLSQGRVPDGGDTFVTFQVATPGKPNAREITAVVVSEVLSHADDPYEDAIELQNVSNQPVDVGHWWLSDAPGQPRKFRIPAGTVIPPGGFRVFYQYQFNIGASAFSLNSYQGDSVVLSEGDAAGNLTGPQSIVTFGAVRNGVSLGRVTTSAGTDYALLRARTFGRDQALTLAEFRSGTGASNAAPLIPPVVISEIHFQPADETTAEDEFLELHNTTTAPALLADDRYPTNTWRIRDGISFDFPTGTVVPAGGFALVVAFNPTNTAQLAAFRTRLGVPAGVPVLGPYSGRLSNSGEGIELQAPDEPEGFGSPVPGFVPYEAVERIRYSPAAPWPSGATGTGASLQRHDSLGYGNEPLNWLAAPPTAGRATAVDQDPDDDGIPSDWETANGLDPEDPGDAALDPDLDLASSLEEFIAGTDPQDRSSVFTILAIDTDGTGLRVTFPSVPGRTYSVQFRPDIGSGGWTDVATAGSSPVAGPRSVTFARPDPGSGVLRVRVSLAP